MKRYKDNIKLRTIIGFILEDLAKVNPRAGRGYGVGATSTTNATKEMLGFVNKKGPERDENMEPVKVSKAFSNLPDSG
jgi:hypothetical protein